MIRDAFIILCCFVGVHVGVVKGRYVLQEELSGYTNRFQRCADCAPRRCCDTDFVTDDCSGGRRCDTFFFFCLRQAFGSTGTGCSYSGNLTSEVNEDDAFINFNQMTFLGLDNPLTLEGLTDAWNGVQLYIEARDEDENGQYQLIDVWRINHILPVGILSNIQVFTGIYRIMTITLRVRVLCAQNFMGSDCTQCIRGLAGPMCDENIDDCLEEMCSGNGQCVDGLDTFTCDCNPGFTGEKCKDNINECMDPGVNCSGNGQCVDEIGSYHCNCSAGYSGINCEINIDDCSPDPCGANGQCIDGVESFTCNCTTGYNGTLCDSDIDECLSNPCGMNQQCENQAGSFNCSCDPGFTGDLCQTKIDDCVGVNCQEIQGSPGIQTGPIIGGVSGGLIFLVLILIIVVAVVLTMRCLNRQGKEGTAAYSDTLPGDNPMYDRGNTAVTFGALTQTSAPVHYVNLSSGDRLRDNMAGSAPDRVFDNPIYGGNDEETEDTYADPDANHHAGTGMGSSPYHEFDNPIYGGEADESSTYSLLADSNATRGGTHTTGNEQVYDHVN